MTRLDALRALLAHVEAGTATGGPDALAVPREQSRLIAEAFGDDDDIWSNFVAAHDGSLDAAKALHDAVLPGWGWHVEPGEACIWHPDTHGISRDVVWNDVPARAWLIAIIWALIEAAAI